MKRRETHGIGGGPFPGHRRWHVEPDHPVSDIGNQVYGTVFWTGAAASFAAISGSGRAEVERLLIMAAGELDRPGGLFWR